MVSFDEKLGVLTPNYTTPYVVGVADLSKSGPFVVELPEGLLAGMIIDVRLVPGLKIYLCLGIDEAR